MNPVCPENCLYDLPGVGYNSCAPQVKLSQLRRFFIGKSNAAAFADWTQAAEWLTRVTQNGTLGNDYIRAITCTGDKPAPKNNTKVIDNGITIQVNKSHTINFTTYQITDDNYNFMRGSECGVLVKLFAYETMGGAFFGSNAGQVVSLLMDDVLPGGDADLENLTGNLQWNSQFSFERINQSPIFDTDFNILQGGALFDTQISLAVNDTGTEEQVTATAQAPAAGVLFEFNKILNCIGVPTTMTLKLAGATVAEIDFPADYLATPFKFTDAAAAVHTGVFAAGIVTLT